MSETPYLDHLYPPLPDVHLPIRLVTLHPGAGTDPIACTLKSDSIPNLPAFEAISYTWGEDVLTNSIFVNGTEIRVRKNVFTALSAVRFSDRDRVLWVDLLSINQSSVAEKNSQVPIMGIIFESARRTLVCLNQPDCDLLDIFDDPNAQFLLHGMNMAGQEDRGIAATLYQPGGPNASLTPQMMDTGFKYASSLLRLLEAPYWNRAWIVQEFLACSLHQIYWSEDYSISGIRFRNLFHRIVAICAAKPTWEDDQEEYSKAGLELKFRLNNAKYNYLSNGYWTFRHMYERQAKYSQTLKWLLNLQETTQCLDARDKVYSVLYLTGELNIQPDYSQPTSMLFWQLISATGPGFDCFEKLDRARMMLRLGWPELLHTASPDLFVELGLPILGLISDVNESSTRPGVLDVRIRCTNDELKQTSVASSILPHRNDVILSAGLERYIVVRDDQFITSWYWDGMNSKEILPETELEETDSSRTCKLSSLQLVEIGLLSPTKPFIGEISM